LARKTPLKKPNRGKEIVSKKPRLKSAYGFLGLCYCFTVQLYGYVVPLPYVMYTVLFISMARHSLFVLKVSLNNNKQSKPTNARVLAVDVVL